MYRKTYTLFTELSVCVRLIRKGETPFTAKNCVCILRQKIFLMYIVRTFGDE